MMVGPLIGGWLLTHFGWKDGVKHALALCIGMRLLTAVFQWLMFEPDGRSAVTDANPTASTISFTGVVKSFTPALRELLVSDIFIRFCERIPFAFVILWAMDFGHVTAQQFGYLISFEMVTAMLCYIPVAHFSDNLVLVVHLSKGCVTDQQTSTPMTAAYGNLTTHQRTFPGRSQSGRLVA